MAPSGGGDLRVRLKDIGSEGIRLSWDLTPSFLRACLGEASTGAPSGDVSLALTRNGARIYARGAVRARVEVSCGRCLEPATASIDSPVEVTFVPASLAPQPEQHEIHGDDPDYCTYSGEEIDLSELVRESVLLGVPLAPLCREDCRGLCPRCGTDRNRATCACPAAEEQAASRLRL
jgi:uncharacterized protein